MKKLLSTLLLCVTATGLFAAVAPKADDLGKALEKAQAQAAAKQNEKVIKLQEQLKSSLAHFKKDVEAFPYSHLSYSNYSVLFQKMEGVRANYMGLRKADLAAAKAAAAQVNEPVSVDNGKRELRIADFVLTWASTLTDSRAEAAWREFGKALEADLKAAKAKSTVAQEELKAVEPQVKQLRNSLAGFVKFAAGLPYSNYSFMFQGMDGVRESFMNLYKASKPAAKALAQEVNQPISIDNGKSKIRIADYVRMESVVLGSVSSREEARWIEFSNALENSLN
ncbi:hypothetical protein [Candidatus Avelusimicrobium facis]|uniref:hypothetical protein n=1 Tax=Candidatus Avelusimicrobium facis TaxID=3416203 RepID=UPI0015B422C1